MSIKILNKKHGETAENILQEAVKKIQRKKQRRHQLLILSCYIDMELVEDYVKLISNEINITDVFFAFDFSEIYKIGPIETKCKLSNIEKNLRKYGINFEWKALTSSKLVHSKGYAIIQRLRTDIEDGVVLITSANFTRPGFQGSNIELGCLTKKKQDIKDFENLYKYLWDTIGKNISAAIIKQNEFMFKFALLSSGLFIHKWSGNLRQQVGIKYELTEFAKSKGTIAPELAAIGFEAGDTFTRQVLNLSELPQKEVPSSFIKRFTTETYWGRWCPASAWNRLSLRFEGEEKFINEFQSSVEESVLQKIKNDALLVQKRLIKKGLIKEVSDNHLDNWADRIQELSESKERLKRIFTGYEVNELPYSIEQKSEIVNLFSSMEETIELSKSKNITQKKILLAIKTMNLYQIKLKNSEKKLIDEM